MSIEINFTSISSSGSIEQTRMTSKRKKITVMPLCHILSKVKSMYQIQIASLRLPASMLAPCLTLLKQRSTSHAKPSQLQE